MIAEIETVTDGALAPHIIPLEVLAMRPTLTPRAVITERGKEKTGIREVETQDEMIVAGKEIEPTVTAAWGAAILGVTMTIVVEDQAETLTIVVIVVVVVAAEVVWETKTEPTEMNSRCKLENEAVLHQLRSGSLHPILQMLYPSRRERGGLHNGT